jgi:hypothetical protein
MSVGLSKHTGCPASPGGTLKEYERHKTAIDKYGGSDMLFLGTVFFWGILFFLIQISTQGT